MMHGKPMPHDRHANLLRSDKCGRLQPVVCRRVFAVAGRWAKKGGWVRGMVAWRLLSCRPLAFAAAAEQSLPVRARWVRMCLCHGHAREHGVGLRTRLNDVKWWCSRVYVCVCVLTHSPMTANHTHTNASTLLLLACVYHPQSPPPPPKHHRFLNKQVDIVLGFSAPQHIPAAHVLKHYNLIIEYVRPTNAHTCRYAGTHASAQWSRRKLHNFGVSHAAHN